MSIITVADQPDLDITVEKISPRRAQEYLGYNISNRNLRTGHVDALARDIAAGHWQLTHMPLAFDTDGNLIDGQHRLHAIIKSETPLNMIVVRGVQKSVQEVIDAGAARSGADALKLSGRVEVNHPAVAAVARTAILWNEGHHRIVRPGVNGSRKVTNSEITEWVDWQNALPDNALTVTAAVGMARLWHNEVTNLVPLSVVAFAFLLLGSVDLDDANSFFTSLDKLEFGEGQDDPLRQLYQRENLARIDKEGLRISQHLYYIVTAWNAYRTRDDEGNCEGVKFVTSPASGKQKPVKLRIRTVAGVTQYPVVPEAI
jgi:hypothetical protein